MNMHRHHLGHGLPPIPPDVEALALLLSAQEVRTHQIGRATDDLLCLSEDPRLCRQFAHRLFISFDGYDEDPREIPDIPECRAYLQALHRHWPYWMHFLAPAPEQWSMMLLCLLPMDPPPQAGPTDARPSTPEVTRAACAIDAHALQALLGQMTSALNHLHTHHAITQDAAHELFMGSIQAIQATMQPNPPQERPCPPGQT